MRGSCCVRLFYNACAQRTQIKDRKELSCCHFSGLVKSILGMDGWMDGQIDRQIDSRYLWKVCLLLTLLLISAGTREDHGSDPELLADSLPLLPICKLDCSFYPPLRVEQYVNMQTTYTTQIQILIWRLRNLHQQCCVTAPFHLYLEKCPLHSYLEDQGGLLR